MNFAAPAFFWAAAIALPVVALYLLKVRRRPVTVPYLRLWESLVAETRARSLFQRLKRLLSLLLQLAILAALVFALTRPSFELGALRRESVVLLLDGSASMRAVEEDGRSRFELLLERARELVEDRSFEDEMLIALVTDRVEVLAPFGRDTLRLRRALEGLAPTRRSLDAAAGIAFAGEASQDREFPVVLFLSDGAAGAIAEAAAGGERVSLVTVGSPRENLGIVRFTARKNTSLGSDHVLAVVRNFGDEARDFRLELEIDGAVRKVLPRRLEAGAELTENFELSLPEGGTLRLHLDHGEAADALALDDEAFAVVRPDRPRKVLLVAPEGTPVAPFQIAFQSMAELVAPGSRTLTLAEYDALDAQERAADVTICLRRLPAELPSRGNLILLDTELPDFLPAEETGKEARPVVWDWDREHLLNRFLNWRDLPIPPARTLRQSGGETLVESYEGPLVSAFDRQGQRVIYVAFDMSSRLFPFRLAFPILLRNALAWFEIEEEVVFEDWYSPGSVVRPLRRLPGQAVRASWFAGDLPREASFELLDGRFSFFDTEEAGPLVFEAGGRRFATTVNLFDPGESDLHPPEQPTGGTGATRGEHLLNRELWTWLVALAVLLWALEWGLYHRRITE